MTGLLPSTNVDYYRLPMQQCFSLWHDYSCSRCLVTSVEGCVIIFRNLLRDFALSSAGLGDEEPVYKRHQQVANNSPTRTSRPTSLSKQCSVPFAFWRRAGYCELTRHHPVFSIPILGKRNPYTYFPIIVDDKDNKMMKLSLNPNLIFSNYYDNGSGTIFRWLWFAAHSPRTTEI